MTMPARRAFRDYARTLDMETGEVTVRWRDGDTRYQRALFVSRTDDMIVCEICADGPDGVSATLALDLHDRADARQPFGGPDADLPEAMQTAACGPFLFYSAANDDGTDFGAVARVVCDGGSLETSAGALRVIDARRVLVCLRLFVRGERRRDWECLQSRLSDVVPDYAALLRPHAKEHGRLFQSVSLDLSADGRERSNEELLLEAYGGEAPTALVERMWAYGRYLLLSSSRPGGQPCPLHGLWLGEYQGVWSFNMANENLQMIYWQALSGNMPETLLAVFDYYERRMDDFRANARHLYGCRGILIPANTAPDSGLMKDLQPQILHWTGAAGWIGQHYWDYYLFTGDKTFLRERALPFLREVALFYADFLVTGENGFFLALPSVSPENTPGNFWQGESGAGNILTTVNATMDFAIAKEVLTHLLQGAEETSLYADELDTWRGMLARIPAYQVNEDGAVREWMHPLLMDNYHHRHQSHVYPVFPGTELTPQDDSELFGAFMTAVKKRLVIGLKEQSGWSLAHMANTYARMGEGNLVPGVPGHHRPLLPAEQSVHHPQRLAGHGHRRGHALGTVPDRRQHGLDVRRPGDAAVLPPGRGNPAAGAAAKVAPRPRDGPAVPRERGDRGGLGPRRRQRDGDPTLQRRSARAGQGRERGGGPDDITGSRRRGDMAERHPRPPPNMKPAPCRGRYTGASRPPSDACAVMIARGNTGRNSGRDRGEHDISSKIRGCYRGDSPLSDRSASAGDGHPRGELDWP